MNIRTNSETRVTETRLSLLHLISKPTDISNFKSSDSKGMRIW